MPRTVVASRRRRVAASCAVLPALVLGSCASTPGVDVVLQTADGRAPEVAGLVSMTTRTFQLGDDGRAVERTTPVEGGAIALSVEAREGRKPTYVSVVLESAGGVEQTGGTAWFDPGAGGRVPAFVGAPGSCVPVDSMRLTAPRTGAATVVLGHHLLVLGGEGAGGPVDTIEVFDLHTLERTHAVESADPLGRARAAALDADSLLVLTATGVAFTLDFSPSRGVSGRRSVPLHVGGETAAGLVSVPFKGAAVVGGGDPANPTRELTWVAPNGLSASRTLNAASGARVVASGGIGLWVASTNPTTFELEFLPNIDTLPIRRAPYNDGTRTGPTLVSDTSGSKLALFGGLDENDAPRTDGYYVTGCPIACFTMPLTWTTAREGFAVDPGGIVAGGLGADVAVDEVVFGAGPGRIEPFATLLAGRETPMVSRLPSGPVFVLGGRDGAGLRDDTELCFGPAR